MAVNNKSKAIMYPLTSQCVLKGHEIKQNKDIQILLIQTWSYELNYSVLNATKLVVHEA